MNDYRSDMFKRLNEINFIDFEDMVYRLNLTYHEIVDWLDKNFFGATFIG